MTAANVTGLVQFIRRLAGSASPTPSRDAELIERFLATRDEASFALLLERYGPMVLGVCRRVLRDDHDAEDAFQATFVILARQAASVRQRDTVGGWLYGVACRVAAKLKTRRDRERARRREVTAVACNRPSHPDDSSDLRPLLDEEINCLPEKYRLPLILCYLEGRTNEEAARQLGCPVGTLFARLSRARGKLRGRLERRGVGVTAVLLGSALNEGLAAAALPAPLVTATLQTTRAAISGQSLSPTVGPLVEGALREMSFFRIKIVAAMILGLSLLSAGAGLWAFQPTGDQSADDSRSAPSEKPSPAGIASPEAASKALDLYGDPLPEGAVARMGTVRWRHDEIYHTLLSPDGKVLATSSWGAKIRVWDRATGKLIGTVPSAEHLNARNWQLAFSPDSSVLACGNSEGAGDYTIRLWDLTTRREREGAIRFQPKNRGGSVGFRCLAFLPDSKTLASAINRDDKIRLWDVASGKEIDSWQQPPETRRMTFSPDGKTLAIAYAVGSDPNSDHKVMLIDTTTKKVRTTLDGGRYNGNGSVCLAFAPDSKMLANAMLYSLYLWDLTTEKKIGPINFKHRVQSVAFAPDGKSLLVLAGQKGTAPPRVHSLDPATGKETGSLELQDEGSAGSLALAPSGKVFALGRHLNTIKLWDASTGKQLLPDRDGHRRLVLSAAFSSDGKTLTSISERTVRHWDLAGGKQIKAVALEKANTVWGVPFVVSPDGRLVATLKMLWDADTGKVRYDLQVARANKAPDRQGHYLASAEPEDDDPDPDARNGCAGPSDDPTCLAFSADSKVLAVGTGNKKVVLWDTDTGTVRGVIDTGGSPSCLALSPDGSILAAGDHLWDTNTGRKTVILKFREKSYSQSLAFSPTGHILAAVLLDGSMRLVSTATGEDLVAIKLGNQRFSGPLTFTPDGRALAAHAGGTIWLYESVTGKEIGAFTGHGDNVLSLAFSANGRRLASGSRDTTCLVWSLPALTQSPATRLAKEELEALWRQLAASEARPAYTAVWTLQAAPADSLPYLRTQLLAYAKPDPQRLKQLVKDLDANEFGVRNQAAAELEKLGQLAATALRQALDEKPPLEMRRRIEQLLDKLRGPQGEELRVWRAIGILEHIGTPDSRQLLEKLRDTSPWPRVCNEASSALTRLAKR